MNPLNFLSGEEWARLVHALLHSLWIGALLAAGLAIVLKAVPARRTDLRYGIAVAAMAMMLVGVLTAWVVLDKDFSNKNTVRGPVTNEPGIEQVASMQSAGQPARSPAFTRNAPAAAPSTPVIRINWTAWAAAVWLIGVAAMLARTGSALAGAGRLRRCSRPVEPWVNELASELRRSLHIARRVGVALCDEIFVPAAMGIFRPLVLLPASMLSIPAEQLRAVLAHELAHIRRHDYLVNIAQMIFESLLFFNPAAWWLSRQIRQEREACCDALATAALGGDVDYAQALAECAINLSAPQLALQSFAGREGSLLDRILRLKRPDYRPRLRLPWHGLILVLIIATVSLACLKKGTEKAVEAAGKFLSAEQVEKMETIQKQYGTPPKPNDTESTYELSGRVRMADGSPLPDKVHVMVIEETGGGSSHSSIGVRGDTFSHKSRFGTVSVYAGASGYPPVKFGPIRHASKDPISNIDLVLTPGYKARVRTLDPSGKPVAGVKVGAYFSNVGISVFDSTTDQNGVAVLDGLSSAPLNLSASLAGYQQTRLDKISLSAGQTFDWTIQPARPTRIKVVDSKTSAPIAGAEFHLVARTAPRGGIGGHESRVAAATDANGICTFDTLDDAYLYHYYIEAPGHRREKLMNVSSGKELVIALGPPFVLKGRIIGADKLARRGRERTLTINANQQFNAPQYSTGVQLDIPVTDYGHAADFTTDRLWEGEVTLWLGDERRELKVSEPLQEVMIDLTQPKPAAADQQPTRTVEIVFDLPPGAPSPRGNLSYNYTYRKQGERWGETKTAPIANGKARFVVPVPNEIELKPEALIGYWVKADYPGYKVPNEPGVFTIKVPAVAAGTIFGKVLEEDGRPATGILISAIEVKKSPGRPDGSLGGSIKNSAGGDDDIQNTFSAAYLPLGGTYVIVVHRRNTYVMSELVKLTEESPMREVTLKLPVGVTVEGRVLTPDGQPAASLPMQFSLETKYSHGFGFDLATDAQGRFKFEHMNPDFPGAASLTLKPTSRWQSEKIDLKLNGANEIRLKPGKVITGQVIDADTGAPIPGCEVRAYRSNPFIQCEAEGPADAQGRFRISTLGEGVFQVSASPRNYSGSYQSPNGEATAGQSQPVTIRIKFIKKSE